jgi:hypothetical protein
MDCLALHMLRRVADAEHGGRHLLGKIGHGLQDRAHFGGAVAVDLGAHVARDGINDDECDVTDLTDLSRENFEIGL